MGRQQYDDEGDLMNSMANQWAEGWADPQGTTTSNRYLG